MFSRLLLPNKAQIERIKSQYPDLDVTSVMSFLVLLRTATELSTALDKSLMKHGLLRNRWLILVMLIREEKRELSPTEMKKALGVTGATLSSLLEGLDRDGLVKIATCTEDRRTHKVMLTQKGVKLLDKVMPSYYQSISKVFADISTKQHDELLKTLDAIQPAKLYAD
jgi:DNA-binding MarR family transcriptional regulator